MVDKTAGKKNRKWGCGSWVGRLKSSNEGMREGEEGGEEGCVSRPEKKKAIYNGDFIMRSVVIVARRLGHGNWVGRLKPGKEGV